MTKEQGINLLTEVLRFFPDEFSYMETKFGCSIGTGWNTEDVYYLINIEITEIKKSKEE